jgi:hypothetical protein
MLAVFCINYLHFALSIWTQMADVLGIKVFSIQSKPTKRKWQSIKTKRSNPAKPAYNPELDVPLKVE